MRAAVYARAPAPRQAQTQATGRQLDRLRGSAIVSGSATHTIAPRTATAHTTLSPGTLAALL